MRHRLREIAAFVHVVESGSVTAAASRLGLARSRARRSFAASFKAEVVALVRQGDRTVPTICREMDLSETAVRRWVEQAAVDAGERDGLTTDEREERRRLRREVRVLRDERDILKRAAAFFAMETR